MDKVSDVTKKAAANAEAAAFGALQQHHADKREDDHEVNDDQYGFHRLSWQGLARPRLRPVIWRRLNTML